MGNNNGKTVSDKDKNLSGGTGGRTISDLDKKLISRLKAIARGVVGPSNLLGKTLSNKDLKSLLTRLGKSSKKGKPHLKHGGKAKKKYGVVGKPTLKKGGKV
jgi:hypothetical protein